MLHSVMDNLLSKNQIVVEKTKLSKIACDSFPLTSSCRMTGFHWSTNMTLQNQLACIVLEKIRTMFPKSKQQKVREKYIYREANCSFYISYSK